MYYILYLIHLNFNKFRGKREAGERERGRSTYFLNFLIFF